MKDRIIFLALFLGGLIAYTYTLAPTLLDGDAALFQYAPHVLAITYPTGFPMYLLAGKLWLTLFPFGEVAWRMNLFSAVCAALTLPVLYAIGLRVWRHRLAALTSVFIYATIRTYWRWATEAKGYTLNILLFSLVLWLGLLEPEDAPPANAPFLQKMRYRLIKYRFPLGAFLFGLGVAGHNTTILLLPGVLLLYWFNFQKSRNVEPAGGPSPLRWLFINALFFALPLLLYFYIPMRAEWLLARFGREAAIAHGLVADFYTSGLAGWIRYFTAADFTGGVVTNWGAVPVQFFSVYLPILGEEFTLLGILLALGGALLLAVTRPRLFWPFFLLYAIPIPFVLTYGRGEQFAFLLPSDLIAALFAGGSIVLLGILLRFALAGPKTTATLQSVAFILIILFLPYQQARYSVNRLLNKWDTSTYDYWQDVLHHPLPQDAGVMAKWGDLTSLWYLQQVEGQRPDLLGLYPETEERAGEWFSAGHDSLYIAGPALDSWPAEELANYQTVPWGRLVLLTPPETDIASLLPQLSQPQEAVFDNKVQLSGAEFESAVDSGGVLYVQLLWQALRDLPADANYSLRLVSGDSKVAQKDDTLLSGWFPLDYIPAGQAFVGAYPVLIPPGTLPGTYELQLAVYQKESGEWLLADGQAVLNLGPVIVNVAPATDRPGPVNFGGLFTLDSYENSVSRVGQGKGFALRMLWRNLRPQQDNYSPGEASYTLKVELADSQGRIWREWLQPVDVSSWQANQQIALWQDITIPAEAPTGEEALRLRLSWLKPDGSPLSARRWIMPLGNYLEVPAPRITAKTDRTFEAPVMQSQTFANFEDKAALIGFDAPASLALGNPLLLQLYWQGQGDMAHSYKVFVHIVDEAGNIVAQMDKYPGEAQKHPTTSWAVGEYITDPFLIDLPANLAPGRYAIVTGLYLPSTGSRLKRVDAPGDSIAITTVELQ